MLYWIIIAAFAIPAYYTWYERLREEQRQSIRRQRIHQKLRRKNQITTDNIDDY